MTEEGKAGAKAKISNGVLAEMYGATDRQDLAHLIGYALINNGIAVETAVSHIRDGFNCQYETNDTMLYFYHLAHMAKHFQIGGSGTLPEESSFFTSVGKPFPAVCIRTSTERPEALDKACFVLAGIDGNGLLQAVTTAVDMNENGDFGIPVPDYTDENVSTKVVKIIQSYTGVVNKMVWRKN